LSLGDARIAARQLWPSESAEHYSLGTIKHDWSGCNRAGAKSCVVVRIGRALLTRDHKTRLERVQSRRCQILPTGRRGRQRKRGCPPEARAKRRGLTNKERSAFVFKHHWLIVKRRDRMSEQERADLGTMLSYLPELKTLRSFMDRLEMLFEEKQSEVLAWGRQVALLRSGAFVAVPELATTLGMLQAEKFAKMVVFLKSPACRRVRTNNHVERVNRKLRHQEKARYKWRKRRRIVRFLVLLLDRWWGQERAIRSRWQDEPRQRDRNQLSPKVTTTEKRVA
jgi:hypothetical protein